MEGSQGRARSLEVLSEIARLLNARVDVEPALDEVLQLVTRLLGLQAAWVFLQQPPGRRLHLTAACGLPPALEADGRRPLRVGSCSCFSVFYKGELREAVNVLECSRLGEAEGDRQGLVYHASVPLRSSSGVVGVLNVAARGVTLFDRAALNLLTTAGDHLGTALERSRLFRRELRRAAIYEAVNRTIRSLGEPKPGTGDPVRAVALRFAQNALRNLGLDAVSVATAPKEDAGSLQLNATVHRRVKADPPPPGRGEPGDAVAAAWMPGDVLSERSLLYLSWRTARAYFGHAGTARRSLPRVGVLPQPGSWAVLPLLLAGQRCAGAVLLERRSPEPWLPVEREALRSLADHLALTLEGVRLAARARDLARVEERHRLARDLHDAVSQNLFSLNMILAAAREHLQAGRLDEARQAQDEARQRGEAVLVEMRRLVQELRPDPGDATRRVGDLAAALSRLAREEPLARHLGVEVEVTTGSLDTACAIEPAAFEALLRVGLEAVHNAAKHGSARRVRVHLASTRRGLWLNVSDDGRGFDVRAPTRSDGQGLSIMAERCRLAGGTLKVRSRPGRGTRIAAWVPAGQSFNRRPAATHGQASREGELKVEQEGEAP